eukprot:1769294-Prymnesium_polylepis.1
MWSWGATQNRRTCRKPKEGHTSEGGLEGESAELRTLLGGAGRRSQKRLGGSECGKKARLARWAALAWSSGEARVGLGCRRTRDRGRRRSQGDPRETARATAAT